MDNGIKRKMRAEIQFHLGKFPDADTKKIKKLLREGTQIVDLDSIRPNTLNKFIRYNIQKFKVTGICTKKSPGCGRKRTACSPKNVKKVRRKLEKKDGSSLRKVSRAVGISHESCRKIARKFLHLKPYHKRKVQKLSKKQKAKTVEFVKWLLEGFGDNVGAYSKWSRLVNSDFSAIIRVSGVIQLQK